VQGAGRVVEHLFQRLALARAEARRGGLPEFGKRAIGASVHLAADVAFELQRMATQALAFEATRRNLAQHLVDQLRQRAHAIGRSHALDQHQRKIMPQRTQVAIWRQQRRPQAEAVDATQALALAPAGEVEELLLGKAGFHVHRGYSLRQS
jgi:hypothetical protein